jgi:hypothetical protein
MATGGLNTGASMAGAPARFSVAVGGTFRGGCSAARLLSGGELLAGAADVPGASGLSCCFAMPRIEQRNSS